MTAQKAKQTALKVNTDYTTGELREVMEKIKRASSQGLYETNFNKNLRPDSKAQLESDGYRVKQDSDYRESWCTVSWN